MADLGTIIPQQTVIPAQWLQDVNDVTYRTVRRVYATGVPATDVANIQAAIDSLGSWSVAQIFFQRQIQLIGNFVLDDEIIYTPCTDFVGINCSIKQTNPAKHCFRLVDELIGRGDGTTRNFPIELTSIADAFPGRVSFRDIFFIGPYTVGGPNARDNWLFTNNEALGTLTTSNVKAAILAAWNGRDFLVENCWFHDWHTGIFSAHQDPVIKNIQTYNCNFAISLNGEANNAIVDAWADFSFVGLGFNYGFIIGGQIGDAPGGQPFTKSGDFRGVYQNSTVGIWIAGLYESGFDALYFEGNQFRDLQCGDGTANGQAINLVFKSITSGGGNGTFSGWTGGPSFDGYVDTGGYFTGDPARSCPISFLRAGGVQIQALNCSYSQGLGSSWAVFMDGNSANVNVAVSTSGSLSSLNPFNTDGGISDGRLTVNKTGFPRWGLTKSQAFYSYPIAWGNPEAVRWGSHDDPTNAASAAQGVQNWISFEERPSTGTRGIVFGGVDASAAFAGDGGEVKTQAATFMVRSQDASEDLVTFKTGFTQWDSQYGQVIFEPACTGVQFLNAGVLFDRGGAGLTEVVMVNLPTADPASAGRLWVDSVSIPGRKLLCVS